MDAYAVPKTEHRYRDPQRFASWLRIALIVDVLVSVAYLAVAFAGAAVPAAAKLTSIFLGIWALAFVISVLLLFLWIFRAAQNARAFGADITFEPAGGIGWLVAPVLGMWMAFVVIDEIWRASIDGPGWRAQHADWPAIYWWFAWVAASLGAFLLWLMSGSVTAKLIYFGAHAAHAWLLRPVVAHQRVAAISGPDVVARIAMN